MTDKDHDQIYTALKLFRDQHDVLKSFGLPNKFGLLLYGPAGTGKTSTIYAIATMLSMNIYYVNITPDMTCGDMQAIFDHIYDDGNGGIVIFEDIDRMTNIVLNKIETSEQTVTDLSNVDDPLTLSYFLNFLDGALSRDRSVIIATTNNPDKLDPAFKRTGRFDLLIELKNACHDQIRAISRRFIGREPTKDILDQIPEYMYSPAKIIFQLKNFMLNVSTEDSVIFEPFLTK